MPIKMADPNFELLNRKREMDTLSPFKVRDDQELKERETAAKAYAGENEQHFVDYANDCLNQSINSQRDIRKIQSDCWNVYNENEPASYGDKEDWQARIIVPKPFQSVQYGAAAVKKAFSPNYLSIKNHSNKPAGEFWKTVMERHLDQKHSDFIIRFTDAVTMGLAVGQSMELIPRWVTGKGLEFTLVEPWKIQRDPDALSRDAQSGMYWIHQEWLDYFVLKRGEKAGRYFDVARVKEVTGEDTENPFMSKEAIAARRALIWERSKFRKLILTSEFWGIVLDPKGELLLPRATYTIAGNRVIQKPKPVPYKSLRWPGVGFSPIPNILAFGGRGLLEGILTIWEAMNNIMCLHQDGLQWVVNPPTEVNVDALVDPNDVESWPGKTYATRDTVSGQQAVRTVQRRSRTNDVLANMQSYDQQFQRGSFVTDGVQGLPGYRKDMTYRESAMNLDQAMGVYSLMGENTERGAIEAITAGLEIIDAHAGFDDYQKEFSEEELAEFGIAPNPEAANGVSGVPEFDGSFHVSGIQALMRENETLKALQEIMVGLADSVRFGPYIKPYQVLTSIVERVNLNDEDVIVSEEEAKLIEKGAAQNEADQADAAEASREMEEVKGVVELVDKLDTRGRPE
jgi:hypothetical protein